MRPSADGRKTGGACETSLCVMSLISVPGAEGCDEKYPDFVGREENISTH
jgi:hypothetical protein